MVNVLRFLAIVAVPSWWQKKLPFPLSHKCGKRKKRATYATWMKSIHTVDGFSRAQYSIRAVARCACVLEGESARDSCANVIVFGNERDKESFSTVYGNYTSRAEKTSTIGRLNIFGACRTVDSLTLFVSLVTIGKNSSVWEAVVIIRTYMSNRIASRKMVAKWRKPRPISRQFSVLCMCIEGECESRF